MCRPALAPIRRAVPLLLQPAPSPVLRHRTAGRAALSGSGHLLRLAARRLLWAFAGRPVALPGPGPLVGGRSGDRVDCPFPPPTRPRDRRGNCPSQGGPAPPPRASARNPAYRLLGGR